MLSLKKYLTEGLIQFTILLSLMGVRVDLDSYLPSHLPPLHEIILGPTSAYTQTQFHSLRGTSDGYGVHPKSVDLDQFFTSRRLLSRMRGLDRLQVPSTELDAWLVHREADSSVSSAQTGSSRTPDSPQDIQTSESSLRDSIDSDQGHGSDEFGATAQSENTELSKEEIDPIDILWLQDIDLGAGREDFESRQRHKDSEDIWEPLGDGPGSNLVAPMGQVDGETGENVPPEGQTTMSLAECLSLLDDPFQFVDSPQFSAPVPPSILDAEPCPRALEQTDGLLSPFLPDMETPLDLEEQWQDLMSLMDMQPTEMNSSGEDPLYLHLDPSLQENQSPDQAPLPGCSQNTSLLAPAMALFPISESPLPQLSSHNSSDLNSTYGFTNLTGILFPSNLNNTANATSTTDVQDPLSGILDEALLDEISLMDLALEEGFSQIQASQLQEELDSDSGLSLDRSPVSPSGSEASSSSSSSCSSSSTSFSEEGAVGYSSDSEIMDPEESEEATGYQPEYSKLCRMSSQDPSRFQNLPFLEHVGHNHTYNMMPDEPEEEEQPIPSRGNRRQTGFLDRQAGRDEQRARAMKIPFSNEKIINLPVEEFNELLTKYQLTEAQLCLVRDIRRRGKNKMAAQNCRKRKLDTILNLEQEVKRLNRERSSRLREKGENLRSLQRMKQEVESLYQEVFSQLRDQEGRPYSPQRYALQYTSNGSIVLMPRNAEGQQNNRRPERKDRRK